MSLTSHGSAQLSSSSYYGGSVDTLSEPLDRQAVRHVGLSVMHGTPRTRTDSSASSTPNKQNGPVTTEDIFSSNQVEGKDGGFVSVSNLTEGIKKLISVAKQVATLAKDDELGIVPK